MSTDTQFSFPASESSFPIVAGPAAAPVVPQPIPSSPESPNLAEQRSGKWKRGIDWPSTLWILFLHLGALAAPFFFTWKGLGLTFFLGWVTGGIGICLGYHRLLTHGSFETFRPIRRLIALIGTLAGQGAPVMWVANHRKHHVFSDQPEDPHSPHDGGWWSHMLWLTSKPEKGYFEALHNRYAADFVKDPFMRMLDKTFIFWHWGFGLLLFGIGYAFWDIYTAWSFVAYGIFLRLVMVLHVTWFVNSATHMWGYRNYDTKDDSKNLWWVGLLAYGEGWHNNHHAFQRMARHGHKWWEFDTTYMAIALMEKCGLAWNVIKDIPTHKRR